MLSLLDQFRSLIGCLGFFWVVLASFRLLWVSLDLRLGCFGFLLDGFGIFRSFWFVLDHFRCPLGSLCVIWLLLSCFGLF